MGVISPSELMVDVLTRLAPAPVAPGGVVVGPANDVLQQQGVVSIVDAGLPVVEEYRPVVWVRTQIRCLAGTLELADRIARTVAAQLNALGRTIVLQTSTNERYLMHFATVVAGPSMHFDTPETWETLLFVESLFGLDPIS